MAEHNAETWQAIKDEYIAGASAKALAAKYPPSVHSITRRAASEKWTASRHQTKAITELLNIPSHESLNQHIRTKLAQDVAAAIEYLRQVAWTSDEKKLNFKILKLKDLANIADTLFNWKNQDKPKQDTTLSILPAPDTMDAEIVDSEQDAGQYQGGKRNLLISPDGEN